jgi:hypothetical protein
MHFDMHYDEAVGILLITKYLHTDSWCEFSSALNISADKNFYQRFCVLCLTVVTLPPGKTHLQFN